jgi:hypothetical protein
MSVIDLAQAILDRRKATTAGQALAAALAMTPSDPSPSWRAAADLLASRIDVLSPQDHRGLALRVIELGHGTSAASSLVAEARARLRQRDRRTRHSALDTLRAAAHAGVARDEALLGITQALLHADRTMRRSAAETFAQTAAACERPSVYHWGALRFLASSAEVDDPRDDRVRAARHVVLGLAAAARAGHGLGDVRFVLRRLAAADTPVALDATRALTYDALHRGEDATQLADAALDATLMRGIVDCVEAAPRAHRGALSNRALPVLARGLRLPDAPTRLAAAEGLARALLHGADLDPVWPTLVETLHDSSRVAAGRGSVGDAAAWALAAAGLAARHRERVLAALAEALTERSAAVRRRAAAAAARIHAEDAAFDALEALLGHRVQAVRRGALQGIGWAASDAFWPLPPARADLRPLRPAIEAAATERAIAGTAERLLSTLPE